VWEPGPDIHRELFDRIPSSFFGFCLDVGHQHSFSRTPLKAWLEELQSVLREIHLHDNDGTSDSHLPIGEGTIDFVELFRYLGSNGMKPLLTLEPHREEHLVKSLRGCTGYWMSQDGTFLCRRRQVMAIVEVSVVPWAVATPVSAVLWREP